MARLIYIDTNIYLDYLENRVDKMRPLGEFAYEVFRRAFGCEFKIIVSEHLLDELEKFVTEQEIGFVLGKIKSAGKEVPLEVLESDIQKANALAAQRKVPWPDTLHAVLAIRGGAECIVTRNKKDFDPFSDLIEAVFPEEI